MVSKDFFLVFWTKLSADGIDTIRYISNNYKKGEAAINGNILIKVAAWWIFFVMRRNFYGPQCLFYSLEEKNNLPSLINVSREKWALFFTTLIYHRFRKFDWHTTIILCHGSDSDITPSDCFILLLPTPPPPRPGARPLYRIFSLYM